MNLHAFAGFLEKAIAMKPPALQYYKGNERKVSLIISHMFVEMAQASCHKGSNGKVFEQMMWASMSTIIRSVNYRKIITQ
jgi:hypothetical protein